MHSSLLTYTDWRKEIPDNRGILFLFSCQVKYNVSKQRREEKETARLWTKPRNCADWEHTVDMTMETKFEIEKGFRAFKSHYEFCLYRIHEGHTERVTFPWERSICFVNTEIREVSRSVNSSRISIIRRLSRDQYWTARNVLVWSLNSRHLHCLITFHKSSISIFERRAFESDPYGTSLQNNNSLKFI
jgi:hypothetical protein